VSGTLLAYLCLVGAIAVERLLEVVIARRNLASVRRRGGLVVEHATLRAAVVVQVAWMASCALEVTALHRSLLPALAAPMLVLVAGAMALRYWAVTALGDRWSLAVVVVPGEPPVSSGPYRFVRHPNYLAVIVEAFALPLVHSAWLTAAVLGTTIAVLTGRRIRLEEAALARHGDYERAFAGTPRLVP
jgi:methyltransferase